MVRFAQVANRPVLRQEDFAGEVVKEVAFSRSITGPFTSLRWNWRPRAARRVLMARRQSSALMSISLTAERIRMTCFGAPRSAIMS